MVGLHLLGEQLTTRVTNSRVRFPTDLIWDLIFPKSSPDIAVTHSPNMYIVCTCVLSKANESVHGHFNLNLLTVTHLDRATDNNEDLKASRHDIIWEKQNGIP